VPQQNSATSRAEAIDLYTETLFYSRVAQMPGARSTWRLNFVQWRLIFVGPQYVTCFWHLEFERAS
jgi:hypothetical protein